MPSQAVHLAYGPFELAVGYSMGAAVLLYALSKGLPGEEDRTDRAACELHSGA